MNKQHDLSKYTGTNIVSTKNPTKLLEKIRRNPEDLERYKYWLEELSKDEDLQLKPIEMSRLAITLMQLDKYDEWAFDKTIDDLVEYERTNDRLRKMNEFVLKYCEGKRKKITSAGSVSQAKDVLSHLMSKDGKLKIEWEPVVTIDVTAEDVEFEEVDDEENSDDTD